MVAHCQPMADKVLLEQGYSMGFERAVHLHYMQRSALIFSVEVAEWISMLLMEAAAISW